MNENVIKILRKFNAFKHFNFNLKLRINDKKFIIPIIDDIGYFNCSISEPWMIDVFKILIPIEKNLFVDVGVNIGQTLLKLKSISSEINYLGFEPNASCVNYIHRLIKENKFENTTVIPVGISNKTELGVLNFMEDTVDDSSASMISNFRDENKVKQKRFIPLFDLEYLKDKIEFKNLSVLKIDVEGAELEVIKSFKDEIFVNKPIILIEILPVYNNQNLDRIKRQHELLVLLFNFKYVLFRVVKQRGLFVRLDEMTEIEIHSDLDKCDYILIPYTKIEKFKANYHQSMKYK